MRGQGQRELFSAGAVLDEIKYFLHCAHDAQTKSCIVNLCEKLLVQRARTDIDRIEYHDPSWIELEVLENLFNKYFPCVKSEIDKIESLLKDNSLSNSKKTDKCLETAIGSLISIKHHIHRFIQMAASKLHKISSNNNKMQEKSVCDFFSHPIFSLETFRSK